MNNLRDLLEGLKEIYSSVSESGCITDWIKWKMDCL